MNAVIVIPARYASQRLPGKPLLRATGKYLVQHVYERACGVRSASEVIVATDDPRIETAVRSFGGQVVRTRRDHASGTDRVAEVAARLDADVVVNLQGDEPLVEPDNLEYLIDLLRRNRSAEMATLATPLRQLEQYHDPNCVKVVVNDHGQAIYFSRSPIPHVRDGEPDLQHTFQFFQHLGVYAYRRRFLLELASSPRSPLEQLEQLEQLRALAMGVSIQVGVVAEAAIGVDTLADYHRFVASYRRKVRRAA